MNHKLTLSLKGERNYIQATVIFDSIITLRHAKIFYLTEIDFSMRRFSNKQCVLIFNDDSALNDEVVIGEYRDTYGAITIQETPELITERIVYDEFPIVNSCMIHENLIHIFQDICPNSFIEKAICAYKVLLQKLFGQKDNFFFFIRITLQYIPSDNFQIIYKRLISKMYYEGSIMENHNEIGKIYFGMKTI